MRPTTSGPLLDPRSLGSPCDADLRLARLPALRNGLEHLRAPALARVEPRRARGDGVLAGPGPVALRPRRRRDRAARRPRPSAGVRDRRVRGLHGQAGTGLHARGARRLGRGERGCAARARAGRLSCSSTTSFSAGRSARQRLALRREGAWLRARVLDARERGAVALGRRGARGGGRRDRRLRAHPRGAGRDLRDRRARAHDPARRRRRALAAAGSGNGARGARRRGAQGPAEPGQRERAAPGRGQRGAARGLPRRRPADRRLLRQADPEQGRPGSARGATRDRCAHGHRRLRRLPRRARAAGRGARRALHRSARAPASRAPARAGRRVGRPVDLPGGFRDGRRGVGRGGLSARRRRPLGPRVRRGRARRDATRPGCEGSCASRTRTRTHCASGSRRSSRSGPTTGPRFAKAARQAAVELWSWRSVARQIAATV